MIDCTLSSLDAKVSKKVMERAVFDLCKDKLVLFVTHDLDHAAQMDQVISIESDLTSPQIMSAAEFRVNIDQLRGKLGVMATVEDYDNKSDNKSRDDNAGEKEDPDDEAED